MWSPAVTKVRQQGIPCIYQPLKEGYRAWSSGLGIPTHVEGKTLDAAYDFVNWYLSGWAGAFLNRQGYYTAVLETAKENMTADEWGYWMEGQAAKESVKSLLQNSSASHLVSRCSSHVGVSTTIC